VAIYGATCSLLHEERCRDAKLNEVVLMQALSNMYKAQAKDIALIKTSSVPF
jgi:hypothetical protein